MCAYNATVGTHRKSRRNRNPGLMELHLAQTPWFCWHRTKVAKKENTPGIVWSYKEVCLFWRSIMSFPGDQLSWAPTCRRWSWFWLAKPCILNSLRTFPGKAWCAVVWLWTKLKNPPSSLFLSLCCCQQQPSLPTDGALLVLPAGDTNGSWRSGGFGGI